MRALLTTPPGGWDHTSLTDIPEPVAADDEVIVEIHAASLNPADRFLIEGIYPGGPKPPFVTGRDAAGIVVHADRAGRFPVGTSVLSLQSSATDLRRGPLCDRQAFRAECLATVPAGWSFAEAAAAPLVLQTAWQALTLHGEINNHSAVVVTGASGGVGLAAVQLARGLGAKVVALSRSVEKQARLKELGVEHVFSPEAGDLKALVFQAIGKKGADVVVDTVGGKLLTTSVHLLGERGRVSVLGILGGVEAALPIPAFMFKRASMHGILVTGATPAESQSEWSNIVDVLTRSGLRPQIDARFSLEHFKAAFDRLQTGPFGKVVIDVRGA